MLLLHYIYFHSMIIVCDQYIFLLIILFRFNWYKFTFFSIIEFNIRPISSITNISLTKYDDY